METGKAPETVSPGAKSSINPQPLPPRIQQLPGRVAGSSTMVPGARIMINPQPLPPRQSKRHQRYPVGRRREQRRMTGGGCGGAAFCPWSRE